MERLHLCEMRKPMMVGGLGGVGAGGRVPPDSLAVYLVLHDIDKVEELLGDMEGQRELAQHVSDATPCPMGSGDGVDEETG